MIKKIKSWWSHATGESGPTYTLQATLLEKGIQYELIEKLQHEIILRIADKFLEEHGEEVTRDMLNNPNFADAVYNAIVLKKAEKI